MIEVRPVQLDDLEAVAAVHDAAFPGSAMTKLGTEAVRRYYEWLVVGPHRATNLVAFEDGTLAGFVFGGVFEGAMTGFLRRNRSYLARRVLTHPWLIASPLFRDRIRLAQRLLFRRSSPAAAPSSSASRPYGILAIAVAPHRQRSGVGKHLMETSEAAARAQGFRTMQLTVVRTNQQAIAFYLARGWTQVVDAHGVWTGAMTRELAPA